MYRWFVFYMQRRFQKRRMRETMAFIRRIDRNVQKKQEAKKQGERFGPAD